MNKANRKLSQTKELAAKLIYATLTVLKENAGELPGRDVILKVGKRVVLTDRDKERYEKSGYIRWQSILHFYTINCVKAGFLTKRKGTWFLTKEGEDALKLGEVGLLSAAGDGYRKWREKHPKIKTPSPEEISGIEEEEIAQRLTLDRVEQLAMDSIRQCVTSMGPYEFQELVAALLRGMGYHTPFVAPRGKDGGVDIIAYGDPLGIGTPRIKVQVKHRESSANVQEIRQLMGLLQKDGDVGIFISAGGFTPDARTTAAGSQVHVELIDLNRFISLWQDFYDKLSQEDKALLPLLPFYFYAPEE